MILLLPKKKAYQFDELEHRGIHHSISPCLTNSPPEDVTINKTDGMMEKKSCSNCMLRSKLPWSSWSKSPSPVVNEILRSILEFGRDAKQRLVHEEPDYVAEVVH